jgi:hypothetical protein
MMMTVPSPGATTDAFSLLAIISDPAKAKEHLEQIKVAADELRDLHAKTAASQKQLAEQQAAVAKELADARARHDDELRAERDAFNVKCTRREVAIAAQAASAA